MSHIVAKYEFIRYRAPRFVAMKLRNGSYIALMQTHVDGRWRDDLRSQVVYDNPTDACLHAAMLACTFTRILQRHPLDEAEAQMSCVVEAEHAARCEREEGESA